MTDDSNEVTNFQHKFLLTYRQVSKVCRAFESNLPANIKI